MNMISKKACLLAGSILLLLTACILILFLRQHTAQKPDTTYTAYLYQDGQLLQTIPLSQITDSRRFTIRASDGGYNTIEASGNGISIAEADCPDQICVLQGTIRDSLLPITCLPHRLVIELKPDDAAVSNISPDAVAY